MLNEQLQKQITEEGKSKASDFGYDPGAEEYDDLQSQYVIGASIYAEKWQAAEQRAERCEKALRQLREHILRCHQVLTNPNGVAMLPVIDEALTPKTSTDE